MDTLGISSSRFAYSLTDMPDGRFANHLTVGARCLNYGADVACQSMTCEHRAVHVVGLCVDGRGEIRREELARHLAATSRTLQDLLDQADRLAGMFVILFALADEVYILTDATASLQVNYWTGDERTCVAWNDRLVADWLGLVQSERARQVRASAYAPIAPLPNDMTDFDGVRVLLPNHYLCVGTKSSVRYFPCRRHSIATQGMASVGDRTIDICRHIIGQYAADVKLLCALTSGWDSRLVLALLLQVPQAKANLKCYTSVKASFTAETADVRIPRLIADQMRLDYTAIRHVQAPDAYKVALQRLIGDVRANPADFAYTCQSAFPRRGIVNGHLVGNIGKSCIGNALPEALATASFFMTRLHCHAEAARTEVHAWMDGAAAAGSGISLYDLFEWESICGRWISDLYLAQTSAGLLPLNIFNCRELLLLWLRVPRQDRARSWIHRRVFEVIAPDLLAIPFNPDEGLVRRLSEHPLLYYPTAFLVSGVDRMRRLVR